MTQKLKAEKEFDWGQSKFDPGADVRIESLLSSEYVH
jgi:hypothetical protein